MSIKKLFWFVFIIHVDTGKKETKLRPGYHQILHMGFLILLSCNCFNKASQGKRTKHGKKENCRNSIQILLDNSSQYTQLLDFDAWAAAEKPDVASRCSIFYNTRKWKWKWNRKTGEEGMRERIGERERERRSEREGERERELNKTKIMILNA